MTTITHTAPESPTQTVTPGERLQSTMAAVRIAFEWLGIRKSLSTDQKTQAAQPFGAEGQYLAASKRLLDTKHPAFKAVSAVKGRLVSFWRDMTLPFPEAGIRLIRQDQIELFNDRISALRDELDKAVTKLNDHYAELRDVARDRLGTLYNAADYPASLTGMFRVEWDFPSVEPPGYLMQLNPSLYEQQRRRMVARFEQAVQLAEDAFVGEFDKLVGHLVERLSGSDDGKPKIFRNSAVKNLHEFFDRFRTLNVHSSEQLDRLVETAQTALGRIGAGQLRGNDALRRDIATQLSAVGSQLEGLMVDRPRRRVLRNKTPGSGS